MGEVYEIPIQERALPAGFVPRDWDLILGEGGGQLLFIGIGIQLLVLVMKR